MPKVVIVTPRELEKLDPVNLNDFRPVLLAEGDSWCSLGSIPVHNLLQQLDFGTHGAVVNLAYPGDTAASMRAALGASGNRRMDVWASELGRYVADPATYPFDAILLSGGGNDLIDAVPNLLKPQFDFSAVDPTQPDGALDAAALALFDRFLVDSFTGIVDYVRASGGPNRNAPIFCHTYDYPTPNDAPATIAGVRFGQAWLYPRLLAANLPAILWQPLTDWLLDHLAEVIHSLVLPDFHVINTLGTIERARPGSRGASGDWDNEIHPNATGYRKLAAKVVRAVQLELGLP